MNRILLGLCALFVTASSVGAWCHPWGPPIGYYPSFYTPIPTFAYAPPVYYVSPIYYPANPVVVAPPTYPAAPTQAPVPQREPVVAQPKTTSPAKKETAELPMPKKAKLPAKIKAPKEEEAPKEPLARIQIDQFLIDGDSKTTEGVVEAKVGFFNHSDRDLTLVVHGEEVNLPKDEYVTLRLPREFKWGEKVDTLQSVTIPADAAGLEFVFRK